MLEFHQGTVPVMVYVLGYHTSFLTKPNVSVWVTKSRHHHQTLLFTLMFCTLWSFSRLEGFCRSPHTDTTSPHMKNKRLPPRGLQCLHRKVTTTSGALAHNDTRAQQPNLSKLSSSKPNPHKNEYSIYHSLGCETFVALGVWTMTKEQLSCFGKRYMIPRNFKCGGAVCEI